MPDRSRHFFNYMTIDPTLLFFKKYARYSAHVI
jgi:hypothetical protein